MIEKLLSISDFDEWYGPIYTCPSCAKETLWDDFKFCPNCGADLKGLKFESIGDREERMKKDNER
jgi:rRNA maturation endonuclease Nob1